MKRLVLALAALFLLRADMYPDASNAKLPEAQQNLGQMASITPQMYGAKGDGTTDDTVAVQGWLNDLKTGAHIGYCQGRFRLTASVNAFPAQPYRVIGAGQGVNGCNFHIDYNSNWAGNAIDLTNPAAPTTRGSGADWSSMYITYNTALTSPPRAIGGDYISDALLRDIKISQYTVNRGQCMSWRQPWNIRQFTNISIWGCGGHASNHLVPAGTTFSIAAASTTLTSSAGFFTAADVGRYITCQGSTYFEAWRIAAYIDPTNVTVNRPASAAHTANLCGINGITGSMTAGSPTLTISADSLAANDIGRVVYVPMAGGITAGITRTALRTTITAVSGTAITLAANAAGAVTDVPIILSPPIEIINANDMVLNELNLEQNAGTMLVIIDSANVRMSNSKLHAYGGASMGQTNGGETNFNAAIFNSFPTIEGTDIEATPVGGIGRVLISGISGGFSIGSTTGILTTGLPHYALIGNAATSGFSFGPIMGASRVDAAWLAGGVANLVYNDGTSTSGALTLGPVTSYNSGPPVPFYQQGEQVPAACNGTADDGPAINAAMLAASTAPNGRLSTVTLPKGICMTSVPINLYSNVSIKGQGFGQTTLKLMPNKCVDVMLGQNAYSLFGGDTEGGIGDFSISEMTIDGNRTNQTGCADKDKVNGIAFYGYKPVFTNLQIMNILGHGMRTEWATWGTVPGGMEGHLQNVQIENTGRHGWWNNGPHDTHTDHLHIANASLEADNTYIGMYEEAKGPGHHFNFHAYVSSGSVTSRPKYQLSTRGNSQYVGSHFEGGHRQVELRAPATGVTRISNSGFLFPHATNAAMMDIRTGGNQLTDNVYYGLSGQANWAMDFGPGGEAPAQNKVSGYFVEFGTSGAFKFTSDGGFNTVEGQGYSGSGAAASITGTPAQTSTVCYYQLGVPGAAPCRIQGANIRLESNVLSEYANPAASSLAMNYNGYQGGTTQFRGLTVYDGKNGQIAHFDGPTRHIFVGDRTPVLTACGTGPVIVGGDTAGTITMGTGNPTTCTITFFAAFASPPHCTVTWQTNLASMQYVLAAASITLTQTATSSNKVNYTCFGSAGG